jgi:hypothetical protein
LTAVPPPAIASRTMRVLVVAVVCLAARLADAASAPPFTDGDFANADWQLVTFSFKSGGGAFPGGTVEATQDASGNPALGVSSRTTFRTPPR